MQVYYVVPLIKDIPLPGFLELLLLSTSRLFVLEWKPTGSLVCSGLAADPP